MYYRTLGKSNIKVSAIGLGCWGIGGAFKHSDGETIAFGHVNDNESIKAVQKGIEMGVTLFDTSNVYGCGRSERVLGKALKNYRDDIVIATKFGTVWNYEYPDSSIPCQIVGDDVSAKFIRKSCEDSLKRLQTDYIDIYQLHIGDLAPAKVHEVISTLDSLVDDGLIKTYGWSTDYPNRAELFAKSDHCSSVQFRVSLSAKNPLMIKILEKYNIGGLVKSPLSNGILTGKYKDDSVRSSDHMLSDTRFGEGRIKNVRNQLEKIKEILVGDDRSLTQAAISYVWSMSDNLVPIPGFRTVEQVEENAKVLEMGPLKEIQIKEINDIIKEIQLDVNDNLGKN